MLVELTKNLILLGFKAMALVAIEEGDLSTIHFDSYVKGENFQEEIHRLNPDSNVKQVSADEVSNNLKQFSCIVKCGIEKSNFNDLSNTIVSVQVSGLIGRILTIPKSETEQIPHFHRSCLDGPILNAIFENTSLEEFSTLVSNFIDNMDVNTLFDLFTEKMEEMENPIDSYDENEVKDQLLNFYHEKFIQHEKVRETSNYAMILELSKEKHPYYFFFDQLSLAPSQLKIQELGLEDLNILIVGAGAIGCELVKNLMVMNACTTRGSMYVTDMDSIELTNLNRQFFFSQSDIGSKKSQILKKMVNYFNSKVNIESFEEKLTSDSESYLNQDSFWSSIDVVFGAVDNDHARQFLSHKCNLYKIPFINSGTQGFYSQNSFHLYASTKPFHNENQKTEEEEREEIRTSCTLKSNPEKHEDLIMWSKMKYEDYFTRMVPRLLERVELGNVNNHLYVLAREVFNQLFVSPFQENTLCNLDELNEDNKIQYFLNESVEFTPRPAKLNYEKESHFSFMNTTIYLLYRHLDNNDLIPSTRSVSSVEFPFMPLTREELQQYENKFHHQITIPEKSEEMTHSNMKVNSPFKPLVYEKDDDLMVQFVQDTSNIRAENFFLFGRKLCKPIEFFKAKKIAGAIHPALITTTSVAASIQCFHLLQYLQQLNQYSKKLSYIKYNICLDDLDIHYENISDNIKEIHMKFTDTIEELVKEARTLNQEMDTIFITNSKGETGSLFAPSIFSEHNEQSYLTTPLASLLKSNEKMRILNISSEQEEITVHLILQ
ncbi:ubiquitin activating enzyme E1 [Naegleria gruberi]|uniref:Ubiquitin activating enzyme E1 n=1 Tax=Naegleria gruberi TaxID=5762 RepID=D2V1X8_NAEGR|nr:ubiquitin activating enzyme E1 [Naegleria gruberi]EFC49389.1 ubiquitin activating enzyme E1 [Naegleria gruberi]|eukprot:XP_002682133.1 ubiquitin activating enzyme E1 [Naegleria gruberi strain NEG-M]